MAFNLSQWGNALKAKVTDYQKREAFCKYLDPENDDYFERAQQKLKNSWIRKVMTGRFGLSPIRNVYTDITRDIGVAMAQNYAVAENGDLIRTNRPGIDKLYDLSKAIPIWDLAKTDEDGKGSVTGLSRENYRKFRYAVKKTTGQVIGNMNPDDVGKMDVALLDNQMFSFRNWMPATVREYTSKLIWDKECQMFEYGRFRAIMSEYTNDKLSDGELTDGRNFVLYAKHVLLPTTTRLISDLMTFGMAPKIGKKIGADPNNWLLGNRVNQVRAERAFAKWQNDNPGLIGKVSFEDYLEVKQAQIKAGLMTIRFVAGMMGLAMYLGHKDPDTDQPRYFNNMVTRDLFKIPRFF